jgi:hypothetical protein
VPRLAKFTVKAIRLKLGFSHPYATLIKQGDTAREQRKRRKSEHDQQKRQPQQTISKPLQHQSDGPPSTSRRK